MDWMVVVEFSKTWIYVRSKLGISYGNFRCKDSSTLSSFIIFITFSEFK